MSKKYSDRVRERAVRMTLLTPVATVRRSRCGVTRAMPAARSTGIRLSQPLRAEIERALKYCRAS